MLTDDNKKISCRLFEEIWNNGDLKIIDEIISEDFLLHIGNIEIKGLTNYTNYIKSYRNAFPDVHFKIEDLIAEEDKVVERYTATGTHKGEFYGIPPTNKKGKISGIDIVRITNGKMTERWGQADLLGLIKQLDIIPELKYLKI